MICKPLLSALAALIVSSQASATDIRRIVTGVGADDKSTVTLDSRIKLSPAPNDLNWAHLWVTDTYPPEISAADTRDKFIGVAPPENGTQFGVVEIPPLNPAIPRNRFGTAHGRSITSWSYLVKLT
jgi:hypothetical protein